MSYTKVPHANTEHSLQDSLNETVMKVRDAFSSMFNQSEPQPYCYVREVFNDYVIVEEGESLYKVSYKSSGDSIQFDSRDKWKEVKQSYVPLQQKIGNLLHSLFTKIIGENQSKNNDLSDFLFSDLSQENFDSQGPKYIDGMAAGTFTAMNGEEVTFLPEELEVYAQNTLRIIESTKTENGEIVGLPIDKNSHDHKGGAGWIVGLQVDKSRNVIRFLVNWTQAGIESIKSNSVRFFSPSVDGENKHIRGGSMTNWPATRLANGQILLRPVELSEQIKELDMEKTVTDMIEDLKSSIVSAITGIQKQPETPEEPKKSAELSDEKVSPALQQLLGSQEGIDELSKKAVEIAQDAIKAERRKRETVEFAAKVVGGTSEKPFGLRVRPADLVALLLSLPERQSKAVQNILEQTLDAAIDFSEHGVDSMGYLRKPKFPAEYKPALQSWLAAGKTLKEFFSKNPEVGEYENFDLTEFAEKE